METTRQEAFELLELHEEATTEQIKQKYWELYNEYNFSLTNAQTDLLKKKFNSKLEVLNNAFQLLCPDVSIEDLKGLNRPSDIPVFNVAPVYRRIEETEKKDAQTTTTKTNHKLLVWAGFLFIMGLAIGVYSIFSVMKIKNELTTAQQQLNETKEENAKYARFTKPVSTNYKFKIENRSPKPVYILWVVGIYNKNGKMESFDSEYYFTKNENEKQSEIRPNGQKDITFTGYDGEVGYYALMYQYNNEWHWHSGFFPDNQRNKAIIIEDGKIKKKL